MKLVDLVDNSRTDKNTSHSYLDLYETLLNSKKESAKNVLEVGVWSGGSIKLWYDYFPNATVYGLDIHDNTRGWSELHKDRIKLMIPADAYNKETLKNNFLDKNIKFDFMLDDGPHTLDSMLDFIKLYSQLLTDDGILIVEDVQDFGWIEHLKLAVPEELKEFIKVYDLRHVKGRWDDIVFTIDKSQKA